jgi:glucose-1-phosphate thymidylyltransferase
MKGIILAGGQGTRLMPLTKVTNKHLLPVGGKPMLQHCVEKLTESGVSEIMIVTGGDHIGDIAEYLGSGKDFGCEFTYRVQDEAGGIAQALNLAKGFVREGESMCVILGDNIFEDDLKLPVQLYSNFPMNGDGALVMTIEVDDPRRFGVAEISEFGTDEEEAVNSFCEVYSLYDVVNIQEKPDNPRSNKAVTGIYFYDHTVFDIIATLKPSGRGELEITDVNNEYIRQGRLKSLQWNGWWTDAGTPSSYRKANELVGWDDEEGLSS